MALLLGGILLLACLLSDWHSRSLQLSAPLLLAALVSGGVTAWGCRGCSG